MYFLLLRVFVEEYLSLGRTSMNILLRKAMDVSRWVQTAPHGFAYIWIASNGLERL